MCVPTILTTSIALLCFMHVYAGLIWRPLVLLCNVCVHVLCRQITSPDTLFLLEILILMSTLKDNWIKKAGPDLGVHVLLVFI